MCGATLISIWFEIFPYDCRLDPQWFWACFRKRWGDLSLEFWSAWWREEEIIQEKGEKSIKVTPLYGSDKKYNAVAHCIEQILYARNNNLITPFAFKRNLVTYSITNSKEITTMNGKWEGCRSLRTVSDVICEKSPPTLCPDGDIINTIDNNQKVGIHAGDIKKGSKVPLSICTTMCHILPQPTTEIQYNQICFQKTG